MTHLLWTEPFCKINNIYCYLCCAWLKFKYARQRCFALCDIKVQTNVSTSYLISLFTEDANLKRNLITCFYVLQINLMLSYWINLETSYLVLHNGLTKTLCTLFTSFLIAFSFYAKTMYSFVAMYTIMLQIQCLVNVA